MSRRRTPMLAKTEAIAMNRQVWVCGFVLLAAMLLQAQSTTSVASESAVNATANRSEHFVELLRRAEAGDAHAQFSVGNAYQTGTGAPKDERKRRGGACKRLNRD